MHSTPTLSSRKLDSPLVSAEPQHISVVARVLQSTVTAPNSIPAPVPASILDLNARLTRVASILVAGAERAASAQHQPPADTP